MKFHEVSLPRLVLWSLQLAWWNFAFPKLVGLGLEDPSKEKYKKSSKNFASAFLKERALKFTKYLVCKFGRSSNLPFSLGFGLFGLRR